MGGGTIVVSIITMITIEKSSSEITPMALPIVAKMSPTSPLGTMPQPMINLSTLPATRQDTILPPMAARRNSQSQQQHRQVEKGFQPYLHAC